MLDNNPATIGALFDLDGVLIDTETEYTRIWGEIDSLFPSGVENFPMVIKGTTLPHILGTYYPDPATQAKVVEMLNRCEAAMEYRPIPGAFEFLKALKDAGIPAALVTSSNDEKMSNVYSRLPGLKDYFQTIVTACDVTRSKPDPEGYRLAAERIGIPVGRCCVFEDSLSGLKAGRSAGARVVALATTLPRTALEGKADRIIDDFSNFSVSDLRKIISGE
ncbi:MAG: HAD family phosphatase [Muribaculaceae bacterium]|nr:HAD family phosphatase [Muribaculaceae bacterium]